MGIISPTPSTSVDCSGATNTACPGAKACAAIADWEHWKAQQLANFNGTPIDYSQYHYVKASSYHCPVKNKNFPI